MKRRSVPLCVLTALIFSVAHLVGITSVAGAQAVSPGVTPDNTNLTATDETAGPGETAGLTSSWNLASGGATSGSSARLRFHASIGQFAAGPGGASAVNVNAGFWQNFAVISCCTGRVGNIDLVGDFPQDVDSSDLGLIVDFLFPAPGGYELPCEAEADLDRSGLGRPGSIDSTDLGLLVNYLFISDYELPECP
jgi:hypothetical protein